VSDEPDVRHQLREHLRRLQGDGLWAVRTAGQAPQDDATASGPAVTAAGPAAEAPAVAGTPAEAPTAAVPAAATDTRPGGLDELGASLQGCTLCKLSQGRTNVVFGTGNPAARLMFIGEGPGRDEDLQGEPFVGAAGQLLNKIIGAMGLRREEVYIANTVKCRPPNNRNPEADELAACQPFLEQQVAFVQPEAIVLLGRVAMQAVLDTDAPLGRMRGDFHDWKGIPVRCTYHPAYLLRSPEDKGKTWADMQAVMQMLGLPGPARD
jgi:DNA polymerase